MNLENVNDWASSFVKFRLLIGTLFSGRKTSTQLPTFQQYLSVREADVPKINKQTTFKF